jgi:FMN phosphatase YigB (HAD superfamily)
MRRLRIGVDFDDTLVGSPYTRLWLRPWLSEQEARVGAVPGTWFRRLMQASVRAWWHGDWVGAFDWRALGERELGIVIPEPPRFSAEAVRPLVLPGVDHFLKWCWDRRAEVVLVTNGFMCWQRPFLTALGWDAVIRRWAAPDTVGAAKPDPRIFEAVGPLDWFIGDRLWQDALGAQRAGIPVTLVGPGPEREDRPDPLGQPQPPDTRVDRLDHWVRDTGETLGLSPRFRT